MPYNISMYECVYRKTTRDLAELKLRLDAWTDFEHLPLTATHKVIGQCMKRLWTWVKVAGQHFEHLLCLAIPHIVWTDTLQLNVPGKITDHSMTDELIFRGSCGNCLSWYLQLKKLLGNIVVYLRIKYRLHIRNIVAIKAVLVKLWQNIAGVRFLLRQCISVLQRMVILCKIHLSFWIRHLMPKSLFVCASVRRQGSMVVCRHWKSWCGCSGLAQQLLSITYMTTTTILAMLDKVNIVHFCVPGYVYRVFATLWKYT